MVWARQEEEDEEEKGGEEFDKDKKLSSLQKQPILLLGGGVSLYLANVTRDNAVFTPRELWSSSLLQTAKGRQDIADCASGCPDSVHRHLSMSLRNLPTYPSK